MNCPVIVLQVLASDTELLLSDDLVAEFWQRGFIANIPLLTHKECDVILQDYVELMVCGSLS